MVRLKLFSQYELFDFYLLIVFFYLLFFCYKYKLFLDIILVIKICCFLLFIIYIVLIKLLI